MKAKPIPFSAPMIRALLEGRKTQTRRIMKPQPYISRTTPPRFKDTAIGDIFVCPDMLPTTDSPGLVIAECEAVGVFHCMGQNAFVEKHSPYGKPGGLLWVLEAWRAGRCADGLKPSELHPGFWLRDNSGLWYEADGAEPAHPISPKGRYRHGRFMPRWASRLTLRITDVRVQRLQEISEEDSVAEGVEQIDGRDIMPLAWRDYSMPDHHAFYRSPIDSYRSLWESINGDDSWDVNPWVWCVSFSVIKSNVDDVLKQLEAT